MKMELTHFGSEPSIYTIWNPVYVPVLFGFTCIWRPPSLNELTPYQISLGTRSPSYSIINHGSEHARRSPNTNLDNLNKINNHGLKISIDCEIVNLPLI